MRQHTSAYVSIRQHTLQPAAACAELRRQPLAVGVSANCREFRCTCRWLKCALPLSRSASVISRRQHTSAYVSIRQHTSAYVSIRQHTSAYVSIRQHTSAYVSVHLSSARFPPRILCLRVGCWWGHR
jgi:hypothetical protein